MNSYIKVQVRTVAVDSMLLLFRRIPVLKKTNEELRDYLQYELAPYPLALFDEVGMQKTKKSLFIECLRKTTLPDNTTNTIYVIDGRFILLRVIWH